MGASSSKDTELENAFSKFDQGQPEKLEAVFDSLSSDNILDRSKLEVETIIKLLRSLFTTLLLCFIICMFEYFNQFWLV